ncbi:hypothetical protein AncyloWKF20_01500 [Ancylobacter sp. WKF20]|uniref:hypothetical protein n=1 Tax=Ancylobacter sp. WKF20 TaxID=3039801 RepID=UPI002434572D|nr:hypothetical protein [Ancylobacter sp. WKF20]WGD30545.1 hypothetical protein AncyloWKF20_01500 [Ancylobacter sp. WKF20]
MSSVFLPGADAPHLAHEPTLDEILADPIISLILRRDGLTAGAVRATLDRERRRLASRGSAPVLRRAA